MSGNPLEPKLRLILRKLFIIPRVMTSGIVITFRIGQSAVNEPKSVMAGHGSSSETYNTEKI